MKRKILLSLMLLLGFTLITGCGSKKEKNENISKEIEEFLVENMPGNWIYSDEKVKINDDNTIELIFNDMVDWSYCGYTANKAIVSLTKNKDGILNKIPSITAVCKNKNSENIAKAVYSSLSDITAGNIESKAKYYDAKGNIISDKIEDTLKNSCATYMYDEILAEPESCYRKHIKITAEVDKVDEEVFLGIDYWRLLVLMKNDVTGTYDDYVSIVLDKTLVKEKPSLKSVYTFYGELMVPDTIETENHGQVTMPTVYVLYADKK